MWTEQAGILRSPILAEIEGLAHGFTTRARGSMAGSVHPPERQGRSRDDLARELGLRLVRVKQVAGSDVALVEGGAARRLRDGATTPAGDPCRLEADALITRERGVALCVAVADCFPILVATADGWCGIAHAGWEGSSLGVVAAMCEALVARGARLEGARAAIGPGIRACCYVIDAARADRVRARLGDRYLAVRDGGFAFDLEAANRDQLRAAGVGTIDESGICTRDEVARLFSHRGERGNAGRGLAFIGERE